MRAVTLLALAVIAGPSEAQDAAGEFHVSGTVFNKATGAVLRQALVTLEGSRRVAVPRRFVELTDVKGAFHFVSVPAGEYSITAWKNGFAPDSGGDRQLTLGPSREDLDIPLSPLAKIAGTVTDADGQPVPGVSVRALYRELKDGRRTVRQDRSVTTDDLGHYRMWALAPGEYYIVAAGRGGGTSGVVGPTPASALAHEGFHPRYYPAAADRASATAIPLTPGQEFQADLRIEMQPAHRVRGSVRNLTGYQQVRIEFLRGDGELSANRVLVNTARGTFEASDVLPGEYLVRATQPVEGKELLGERRIQVGKANVDGMVVELVPGVTVSGVVRGAKPVEPSPDAQTASARALMPIAGVTLVPVGSRQADLRPWSANPGAEGSFAIEDVPAGRYRVSISPFGYYVASAISGPVDLLTGILTVPAGVAPEKIEIVIRDDGGNISGTVESFAGSIDRAWVLLVSSAGEPQWASAFGGTFQFRSVAPGDYQAFLVGDISKIEYRNPEVIRGLRNGHAVRVTARETVNVNLKKEFAQ
jgi:hypothetical protein